LLVRGKVGANSKEEVAIWRGPNIKSNMDIRDCCLEFDSYSVLVLVPGVLSLDMHC
jgi:hypothetical protein